MRATAPRSSQSGECTWQKGSSRIDHGQQTRNTVATLGRADDPCAKRTSVWLND